MGVRAEERLGLDNIDSMCYLNSMKSNKPAVKKNKHELPAVVRLAWAVDFAVRQKRYRDIDPAIVALREELDRLEAETDAQFVAEQADTQFEAEPVLCQTCGHMTRTPGDDGYCPGCAGERCSHIDCGDRCNQPAGHRGGHTFTVLEEVSPPGDGGTTDHLFDSHED